MKANKQRFAMVREEFYCLTKDFFQALVLNQFNFYQLAKGHGDFIQQELARSKIHDITDGHINPTAGWFYKSADELCEELMHPFKKSKAHEVIQALIEHGWVMTRANPSYKYDKVKQYRMDLVQLQRDLFPLGFEVPKWDTKAFETPRNSISTVRTLIPSGGNHNSTGWRAIPEETPKETTEEDTPLPPHGGGTSQSSPGINITTSEIGHVTVTGAEPGGTDSVPAAAKDSPGKDWLAMTRDDPAAIALSKLFSDPNNPVSSPAVARKFVKRREGVLCGKAAFLLAEGLPRARFEGIICPEWRKVKTFDQLLDARILRDALAACREAVVDRVKEIEFEQDLYSNSWQIGVQQMHFASSSIDSDTNLNTLMGYRDDVAACCAVALQKGLDLAGVHVQHRNDILHCLVRERHWLEMFNDACIKAFGISREEIVTAQDAYWKPIESEKQRLQNLLD